MTKERYFDDLKAGDRFKSEPLEVTEKQVIEFAHKFDPQMFHLTRKSAERTIFKGLIASGWHTAAMTMRLFVQTLNFAEGAIGLGVDELRWPNAVRPGDALRGASFLASNLANSPHEIEIALKIVSLKSRCRKPEIVLR